MSRASCVGAVLLSALAGTAMAQPGEDTTGMRLKQLTVPPTGMQFVPQSEVNQLVFSILSPSAPGTTSRGTGGRSRAVVGADFPSFPPAQGVTFPVAVNGIAYGWIAFGDGVETGTGLPLGNFDLRVTFYDTFDPAGAPPFVSTVLGTFNATNIAPNWGFIEWFQDPLAFANGGTISFPDANWAYEYQILETGTNNLWGTTRATGAAASTDQIVPCAKGPGNNAAIGNTNATYFGNDPLAQGTATYADIVPGAIGAANNQRYIYLKLSADLPVPPPPNFANIVPDRQPNDPAGVDCANGVLTRSTTIAPATVNWFKIDVLGDVSVDANTYLDITCGDFFGLTDAAMGLYLNDGNLVASDQDNGDTNSAFLTFGHGRRPAFGDSIQGDGRNGDLAAGTYFLAVTGADSAFGESSFSVNVATTISAGDVDITIATNTGVVGCALPTPVAPVAVDVGALATGVTTTSGTAGFGDVQWLTFNLPFDVLPTNANFLDITTAGTTLGDTELGVYDSAGLLVASDDDTGDGALSQLSFSAASTPARPSFGDGEPAGGQNGETLLTGQYFLCVGLFNTDYRADGWQARSDSGSRLTININFRTPAGCTLDINGDGNIDPDDLSDAISCFFDDTCTFDFDGTGFEDPDDLSTYISGFFSGSC